MGLFDGLWLVVLGVLGAANLIIAKKPDAKELIGKLAPYQGWIGAVAAVWGALRVILSLLNLGMLSRSPLTWVTWTASALLLLSLGLLLGVGVLKTFISNAEAQAKMDQTIAKLAPYQGKLGVVAICLGIWAILSGLLFRIA